MGTQSLKISPNFTNMQGHRYSLDEDTTSPLYQHSTPKNNADLELRITFTEERDSCSREGGKNCRQPEPDSEPPAAGPQPLGTLPAQLDSQLKNAIRIRSIEESKNQKCGQDDQQWKNTTIEKLFE